MLQRGKSNQSSQINLSKKANLKTEKLELQVKLDINGDELQEAREKKKKLERQLAKKETAAEKKAIRFKPGLENSEL